ncbi:MAG: hypothetical protein IKT00_11100 [Prevotella sp.]|nr:hypothetical protein [Prevotella sp.]
MEKTITFSVLVITTKNEAYPNKSKELLNETQKMAQIRYESYVRKTQENWED